MTPIIGNFTYLASQIGCVMDCDPVTGAKIGGGTPTDNTVAINTLLATATHTAPVKLILDGGAAVRGIVIPLGGHVTIEGLGNDSGLFLIAGSNTHLISNWTSSTQAASTNVQIRNLYLNGNYPNNGSVGTFECGIFLYNCSNIVLDLLTMVNVTYFNVLLETVTNVQCLRCTITSTHLNADGFHVSGGAGCSQLVFDGNTISTYDDAVALNAPENQGGPSTGGPISDVRVSNNVWINGFGFRCYSSSGGSARVSRVQCTNNSGTLTGQSWANGRAYLLGNTDTYADGVESFSASNSTYQLTESTGTMVRITDSCGIVNFSQEVWDAPIAANPFVDIELAAVAISELNFNNCSIYRNTRGSSAAYLLKSGISGASIARMRINGFNILNQSGQSYSAIAYLIDMLNLSIGELIIDALDTTLITALVNPTTGFTGITKIGGAGVLQTGFQIPDSVMANNTPYISATGSNAGNPCIKIGGTVYPYVFS